MIVDKGSLYDVQWNRYFWNRECNLVSTWVTLAVNIHRNADDCKDDNERHLFVTSVSRVFETMRLRIGYSSRVAPMNDSETVAPMTELLSCMVDILRWSLVHTLPNCGAYISLPWVKDIMQCYQAAQESTQYANPLAEIPFTGDPILRPTFLLVVRLLQTCLARDLLTGETILEDVEQLLELLGHPELPELPADLTVEALGVSPPVVSPQVAPRILNALKVSTGALGMMPDARHLRNMA